MNKDTYKIILVEDNEFDAEAILNQIDKGGIKFIHRTVENPSEFADALKSFDPDVIISAYMLSEMTGLDALRIRGENAPEVPFILVTGLENESVAVECMKAGADDYLMKKNLSRLVEAIKSAINKKELIRQKRETENLLRESEENYRLIIDHLPDAVIVTTVNEVLYANPAALKMIGVESIYDLNNTDLKSFIHPDYAERVLERYRRTIETGVTQGYVEEKYINSKGEILEVEVIGIPVIYMGQRAMQSIFRNITERKKVEEELIRAKEKAVESDQLKTAFLHNISHEIRTPMNAITGFSALMNEPDLSPETQRSYLKIITESSDQLLAIVNDIIEISNIEVGILKATYNEVNLNALLVSVYQQFSQKSAEKKIDLRLHTSLSGNKVLIETDSLKLINILSNLLSNAFKFTKKGRIDFGYTLRDDYLQFFVCDTGIGIEEDQYERIFERFYQVESSAARSFEGTGLGLSISRAYVEFLGGRIWVVSSPGNGSIFYFTLPYIISGRKNHSDMESTGKQKVSQIPEKSILIAEDDDNNFFLMKELLSDMNLRILRASNGIEAVDAFRAGEKIDLVLMDIKMPLMDGYEATRQILEEKPDARILAQTAYADDEVKALESGCLGFISKPFVKDRFVSLVREYL